jgi:alcohol dehydrogenase class IV
MQFAEVASWLGESVDGLSAFDAGQRCVEAIQMLKRDVGLPIRLRDIGIEAHHLRPMAEQAATYQRLMRMSARPLTIEALLHILERAL